MTETRDKLIIEASEQGVAQTTRQVENLGRAMDGVQKTSEQTERSSLSLENRFKALERQLGTTAGEAQKFEKVQAQVNRAVAQNPALQDRGNAILEAAARRYNQVSQATDAATKSTGLARHELINLSRQLQDITVSLGSGQSFGTVLLQQGTQVGDIFANSTATAKGFFGQIASGVASVITPMRLLVGGVLGAGAAALYLGNSWSEANAQIDRSLIGIGARTGSTAADLQKFARDNSSAAGLSIGEARNVAIEFTRTGAIAVAGLKGVGDAIHGYAVLTGKDAKEATRDFASALGGDLVKGAEKLNETYGFLDSRTRTYIQTLELAGDRSKALQVILGAIEGDNRKAADSVGFLEKAYTAVGNAFKNILSGPNLSVGKDEQLAALTKQRDAAAASGTTIGTNARGELVNFGTNAALVADLDAKIKELNADLAKTNADGAAKSLIALSEAGDQVVRSVLPQIDQLSNLQKVMNTLEAASTTPGVSRSLGADSGVLTILENQKALLSEQRDQVVRQAEAVRALRQEYAGVATQTAQTLASLRDQLSVAQAVTGQEKNLAVQRATYNQLKLQGVAPDEAARIAADQRAVSEAAATASVEQQTKALRDQADMIRAARNGTEASTASAIVYRQAIESGASAASAAAAAAATESVYRAKSAADAERAAVASQREAEAFENAQRAESARRGGAFGDQPQFGGFDVQPGQQYTSAWRVNFGPDFNTTSRELADTFIKNRSLDQTIKTISNFSLFAGQFVAGDSNNPAYARDRIDTLQTLYDLKNAQTTDRSAQLANYQEFLAIVQSQPETLARDQKIVELMRSINDLTKATDANTAATAATLNPLYSQGHGALAVGYYKAAGGMDAMVHGGIPGVDSVPIHIMAQQGERVKVIPRDEVANDNSRTVNNFNNFVFNDTRTSNARRSYRQFAQGFGQSIASVS